VFIDVSGRIQGVTEVSSHPSLRKKLYDKNITSQATLLEGLITYVWLLQLSIIVNRLKKATHLLGKCYIYCYGMQSACLLVLFTWYLFCSSHLYLPLYLPLHVLFTNAYNSLVSLEPLSSRRVPKVTPLQNPRSATAYAAHQLNVKLRRAPERVSASCWLAVENFAWDSFNCELINAINVSDSIYCSLAELASV